MKTHLALIAALVTLFGCASTTPIEGKATPEQLRAAARYTVTASQQAAIILHKGGVLGTDDFLSGVQAIRAAREALNAVSLSGNDETVKKAIAVAQAAWKMADAAFKVANAAQITPEQAAQWEAEGIAEDKAFDAYAASLTPVQRIKSTRKGVVAMPSVPVPIRDPVEVGDRLVALWPVKFGNNPHGADVVSVVHFDGEYDTVDLSVVRNPYDSAEGFDLNSWPPGLHVYPPLTSDERTALYDGGNGVQAWAELKR